MIPGRSYAVAPLLSAGFALIFLFADSTGTIQAEGILGYLLVCEVLFAVSPFIIFLEFRSSIHQAGIAFILIWYLMLLAIFFGTSYFLPMVIVVLATFLLNIRKNGLGSMNLAWVSVAAFFVMIVVSGILRITPVSGLNQILAFSIYNNEQPSGVPLLFYNGIVFQGPLFVYTFSVPTFLVYSIISVVLSKNYSLIYRTYRGSRIQTSSLVSGAATVLSCQCEGITGTLPSIAALAISTLIVPVLMESVLLVILTLVVLLFIAGKRKSRIVSAMSSLSGIQVIAPAAVFIILVPLVETVSVAMGFLSSPLFFFGINFLMFVNGALLLLLVELALGIRLKASQPLLAAIIASVLMTIWFDPSLVTYADTYSTVFVLMNLSMIAAGMLALHAYLGFGRNDRILFLEFLSMMFVMTGIIVLYLSAFSNITVWGVFSFSSQLFFSLILLTITLPIMWFITNLSLIRYASETGNSASVPVD